MSDNKFIKVSEKYEGIYYKLLSTGAKTFYITYKINGVKKWEKISKNDGDVNVSYCKKLRDDVLYKIRHGEKKPPLKNERKAKTTFNDIRDLFFEKKRFNPRTKASFKTHIDFCSSLIGDLPLENITSEHINNMQNILEKKGKANKTINMYIETIKTVFNFAIDEDLFSGRNPVIKVKMFSVDNDRDRYLSSSEIETLREAIKDNPVLRLFVELSLCTGGRLQTIMNISKKDVNFDDGTITLKNLKTDKTYTGYIGGTLAPLLKQRYDAIKNPNEKIVIVSSRIIQRTLKEILDKLFNEGLDIRDAKNRVVVHTLRHTFASHLANNEVPIYQIQTLMNHKDIKQTQRYAKLSPDSGAKSVKGLF